MIGYQQAVLKVRDIFWDFLFQVCKIRQQIHGFLRSKEHFQWHFWKIRFYRVLIFLGQQVKYLKFTRIAIIELLEGMDVFIHGEIGFQMCRHFHSKLVFFWIKESLPMSFLNFLNSREFKLDFELTQRNWCQWLKP